MSTNEEDRPQLDADKLRRANVGNIIKKLKAGKTLSAAEARAVESFENGGNGTSRMADMVESMKAAASRASCTIDEVKLAKAMGCEAFKPNNRISISQLTAFIRSDEFTRAATESAVGQDWDMRLLKAKALREEVKLKRERGEAWDAEQMRALITAGDRAMLDALRKWLEGEQPPLVEGKSAAAILAQNRKFLDSLAIDLRASRDAAMTELSRATVDEDEENEGGAGR